MIRKLSLALASASLIVASIAGAGCSSNNPDNVVDDGKAVSGVSIQPNKTTVTKGVTIQFNATVEYADGTSQDVTRSSDTVWNTSDPKVATVSTTGEVTTVSDGVVDITANYKGETGDEHFAVTP